VISSRSTVRNLAVAAVVVLGASACQSNPSAERVAEDLIKTQTQDHPDIQECMLAAIEDYDLNSLGDDATSDNAEVSGPALAELDEFEADLVACDPEGVTRTSAP
jgi:hypothetical protein